MTSIVVFMHDLARTGVVINAVRLANALASRGHRVTVAVCRERGRDAHALHPDVRLEVLRKASQPALPRAIDLLFALPLLRRRLRRIAPDVLLSAGNHGHWVAVAASSGLAGLRRILRVSNDLEHQGDGWLVRRARGVMQRWMIRRADRLLLVNGALAKHPLLAAAVASGRAVVTPNGVQVEEVRRLARMPCPHPWLEQDVPVVVAVGRLARVKNFATLVRAVARAAQSRPMRLIIVGGGPVAERERLQAVADSVGFGHAVHFHGEAANPSAFVSRASVFVLPSLWEGASNALLEALACGVPIVAARSAGNAQEVLGYGRFGLLVDALDVEGMAQAVLYQAGTDATSSGPRAQDFALDAALLRVCTAVAGAAAPVVDPLTALGQDRGGSDAGSLLGNPDRTPAAAPRRPHGAAGYLMADPSG